LGAFPVGSVYDVYVYSDPDGDPANGATYVDAATGQTVTELDVFLTTTFETPFTIDTPGDVLIAVVNRTGTEAGAFPAAIDETSGSNGRSWIGFYGGPVPDPPVFPAPANFGTVDSFGLPGNWLVRGTYRRFAVPGPGLAADPAEIAFGGIPIDAVASRTVTLRNNGTDPTTVASVAVTGSPTFTVDLTGTDLTLDPDQSTTFTVQFSPSASATFEATVTVVSNAAASPATVALTGLGTDLTTASFCYGSPLTILDAAPASVYPAAVTVSGITNPVFDVDVRFLGLSHGFPGDIDAFVEHPLGPTSYLMSDAGGGTDAVDVDLTFDDEAAGFVPTPLVPGAYRPTGSTGTFPAPAPTPAGTTLTAFDGADPNGTWRLYLVDDSALDAGSLADWCVDVTTNNVVAGEPGADAGPARLDVAPNPMRGTSRVRLTVGAARDVTVAVYDVTGRRVATLFDGPVAAGQPLEFGLDGAALPAGVYLVRATGADVDLAQRVTVVR
jgi:hypothetical protein